MCNPEAAWEDWYVDTACIDSAASRMARRA